MELKPIVLSVKRGLFRCDDMESESDAADYAEKRQLALARNIKTCQFCGFQSDKWLDIHHKDDNHHNNDKDNLITACKICHACHHLWLAGQNNGGYVIYLPEISQADLNRLVRSMYVIGKVGSDVWRTRAGNLWQFLLSRTKPVIDSIGSFDPVDLGLALSTSTRDDYEHRVSTLAPLRFLISQKSPMMALKRGDKVIGNVIDYWVSSVYQNLTESSWMDLADQVFDIAETQEQQK